MQTQNRLLAAFLKSQRVEVRKLDESTFDIVGVEENNVLIAQFAAEDGYNANIHRIEMALNELDEMPIYSPPAESEQESEEA